MVERTRWGGRLVPGDIRGEWPPTLWSPRTRFPPPLTAETRERLQTHFCLLAFQLHVQKSLNPRTLHDARHSACLSAAGITSTSTLYFYLSHFFPSSFCLVQFHILLLTHSFAIFMSNKLKIRTLITGGFHPQLCGRVSKHSPVGIFIWSTSTLSEGKSRWQDEWSSHLVWKLKWRPNCPPEILKALFQTL